MRAVNVLPEGYREIYSVHLQKEKRTSLLINGLGALIAVLLVLPACFIVPISTVFTIQEDLGGMAFKLVFFAVMDIVYMVLHELVHGLAMKLCGTKKVKYGFTGLYAYAGSEDYYGKKAYILIALAPVVLWGIVLAVATVLVPTDWFWPVYAIQIINLSGAAGDYFVTAKFFRFPEDILVRDCGVGMTVYSRQAL